jgi:hypothetical protein
LEGQSEAALQADEEEEEGGELATIACAIGVLSSCEEAALLSGTGDGDEAAFGAGVGFRATDIRAGEGEEDPFAEEADASAAAATVARDVEGFTGAGTLLALAFPSPTFLPAGGLFDDSAACGASKSIDELVEGAVALSCFVTVERLLGTRDAIVLKSSSSNQRRR